MPHSQRCRKRIEEVFGWIKSSAGLAKVKLRGRARGRYLYVGACRLQSDPPAQAAGGAAMSVRGKWRVVETPDHDMAGAGSYILFTNEGGEFALDCLTGAIHGRCEGDAVEFNWDGSDEMEPARGRG